MSITSQTKNRIIKFVSEISGLVDQVLKGELTKGLPSMILEGIEKRLIGLVEDEVQMRANEETRWNIWSIEHNAWWGPNHRGYVEDVTAAGVYTYQQAIDIVEGANYNLRVKSANEAFNKKLHTPNEAMIRV